MTAGATAPAAPPAAGRRHRRGRGPPAADRRHRLRGRRASACSSSSRSSRTPTPSRSPRASRRRWRRCGRASADMSIDSSVYRPASFIESSFQQPRLGTARSARSCCCSWSACCSGTGARPLIIAAVIPVSLAATAVVVLYLRGTTVNPMIVAGLVLGLTAVIHDAVVDIDAIARPPHPRASAQRGSPPSGVARRSSRAAASPAAPSCTRSSSSRPRRCRCSSWARRAGAFLPPIALVLPARRRGVHAGRRSWSRRRWPAAAGARRRPGRRGSARRRLAAQPVRPDRAAAGHPHRRPRSSRSPCWR